MGDSGAVQPGGLGGWNGVLLVKKPAGISSFGVIEALQRGLREGTSLKRRDLPKLGHGGTLDPFATGLLPVCVGQGVKLARYFLGGDKEYTGEIRFGQTTASGDLTDPVTESGGRVPESLAEIQAVALRLTEQAYLQIPPMHSAKKLEGKPLYELARVGIEVEREPVTCFIRSFQITSYAAPVARFRVLVSSGTYIRVLAQDLGRLLGTVAMLDSLERTRAGAFDLADAVSLDLARGGDWPSLGEAWIPFDRTLLHYPVAEATADEARALIQGRQSAIAPLLPRARRGLGPDAPEDCLAIYHQGRLISVARQSSEGWTIERVFTTSTEGPAS